MVEKAFEAPRAHGERRRVGIAVAVLLTGFLLAVGGIVAVVEQLTWPQMSVVLSAWTYTPLRWIRSGVMRRMTRSPWIGFG